MIRRIAVCSLLVMALAVSAVGWPDSPPESRSIDSSVILASPPGLAMDAALSVRADLLSSSWIEHRVLKPRLRFVPPATVGLGMLVVAGIVTFLWLPAGPTPARSRRWSVALRAPPRLRLT